MFAYGNMTTTSELGESQKDHTRSQISQILMTLLMAIIILLSIAGNILVITAVYFYRRLRCEVSSLFIVNLSITDLSSAMLVMTSSVIAIITDRWIFSSTLCAAVCGINYCLIIVSMLTMCLISLDRYVAMKHSLRYVTLVTRTRVITVIIYAWIQGIAFGLTPVINNWARYDYWEMVCAIQWHLHGQPVLLYVIVAFIVCFFFPGAMLAISYCLILNIAQKIKPQPYPAMAAFTIRSVPDKQQTGYNTGCQRPSCKSSSKTLCSLLVIMLTYIVCMTPFSLTKLYKVAYPEPYVLPGYANMLATTFQYIASAVNPLIYGLLRKDFHQAFLHILWRFSVKKSQKNGNAISEAAFSYFYGCHKMCSVMPCCPQDN